ncbi:hypothetical protein PFISCL1PPCAC_2693, partial [Pristionchus fissidentatus]
RSISTLTMLMEPTDNCETNKDRSSGSMPLRLDSIPQENLFHILSFLSLSDRWKIRGCCKFMKESIERSDHYADDIALWFYKPNSNAKSVLEFEIYDHGTPLKILLDYDDQEALQNLQITLKRSFRRVKFGSLHIVCHAPVINDEVFTELTVFMDCQSLDIRFDFYYQPGVISSAIRSGFHIHRLTLRHCPLDRQQIVELPPISEISVQELESDGFDDNQILAIVRKEPRILNLSGKISDASTLHRVIKMVRSSQIIEKVNLRVCSSYFHRLLASMNLREETDCLVDTICPRSPVVWAQINTAHHFFEYYLYDENWYLHISANRAYNKHTISVVNGKLPEKDERRPGPVFHLSLRST